MRRPGTKRHIKPILVYIAALSLFFPAFASSRWVEMVGHGCRVMVSDNWSVDRHEADKDIIYEFASPDGRSIARLRSFPVSESVDLATLVATFEYHFLRSCQRKSLADHEINGTKGKLAKYEGDYNGEQIAARVFYVLRGGRAYILWSKVPLELGDYDQLEANKIIESFTLEQKTISSSGVVVTSLLTGEGAVGEAGVRDVKYSFSHEVSSILASFSWTGDASGGGFTVKWSGPAGGKVEKQEKLKVARGPEGGRIRVEFPAPSEGFKPGNYKVEVWQKDMRLKAVNFSIE